MKARYVILAASALIIAASGALGFFLMNKSRDIGTPPNENISRPADTLDGGEEAPSHPPTDNSSDNTEDTENIEECAHKFYEDRTIRYASCTSEGLSIDKCSLCQDEQERALPTLPHTEVADLGFAATCLSSGLTDGKHCSDCGTITVPQAVIPTLSHVKVVKEGYEATCTESGLTASVYCEVCGSCISESAEIPPLGHTEAVEEGYEATCTVAGLTDKTYCSKCNIVLKEAEAIEPTHSVGSDGSCSACGQIFFTKGLKFSKISGKEQYKVTGYTGKAKEILIPSEYNKLPVTAIEEYAFEYCEITSISIPNGITEIGAYAFANCAVLESVFLPSSLCQLGEGAFINCVALSAISVPNVGTLPSQCFKDCASLVSVTLAKGIGAIGDEAFYGCSLLTSITLPEGVEQIGAKAFYNCKKLNEISLPLSLSVIGVGAFQYCSALALIVYRGSAEAFEKISFANQYSDPRSYGGVLA